MCDAVSWDQCICKETECVPGSPGTHNDEDIMMPDETAESASWTQPVLTGAVRTQPAKTTVGKGLKDKKRKASDGTTAKTLLKYFKTAPSQDASDRNQKSIRQKPRSVRQKSRSVSPTTRSVRPTTRSVRQTTRSVSQTTRPVSQTTRPVSQTTRPVSQTTRPVSQTTRPVSQTTRPVSQTTRSVRHKPIPR